MGTELPGQITSAHSECERVRRPSITVTAWCLHNDVGFIYEVMADVWEGGKKVKMGRD